ncbi:helix-turn-helix transcriptional regulator [Sandarakinorhabdus sp. AAP62]|uniref:helix-turn-helix domain-containing protein n=1 Tax=Sandarakinorhabdus sp. AAP62 TaxID=1248916 RepID=UPI00037F0CFD|nr:helix-turn-helix transcriptional regulator [Sandarakinorhabdus sp. AAP62]
MTPFGKAVRHLRIEHEMLLGTMADALDVSSSYLSQIESGKKPIPQGFADRVAQLIGLDAKATVELRQQAALSMAEFKIHVADNAPASDRILAGELAHEFARLTPEAKDNIARLLRGVAK